MRFVVWLILLILISAIIWIACGNGSQTTSYSLDNCEGLSEVIIERSKQREESTILKMYGIKRDDSRIRSLREAEANTTVILGCVADARWNRGSNSPVWFWIEEDADGDSFTGWVRIR